MFFLQEKKLQKLFQLGLPSLPLWGLCITLTALFLMGGSSRPDVQSLALLNPLMIICCGVAMLTLKREHLRDHKGLLGTFLCVILLVATYFLPISGWIVSFSIGARDVAAVRALADASGAPRTLSIAPSAALQSLVFLFAPLAVLLFALQMNRDELRFSVPLLIAAGAISGVIGVFQLAGSASGPLYFYQITNNGSAVGLFANRNHAAVFLACLFPMLALFAAKSREVRSGRNTQRLIAIAIAVILIPLLLVTGSRSGMLTAVVGLIGATLLYASYAPSYRGLTNVKSAILIWGAVILMCLVLITVYFSRAESIERLFSENGMLNDRADFWASNLLLFWQYFPFGFGPGGFVPASQNVEPIALLNGAYLNRLHNDWLETAMTFGVAGTSIMLTGAVYCLRRLFVLWVHMDGQRSAVALGRMASIIIAILGIASISDYPMRTPAMAGFGALLLVWFGYARPSR